RLLRRAAPVPVALQQRLEQFGAQRIPVHFVFSGELPHHRQFVENFCESLRVASAGRRFSIIFGKFQRIGKQKGVQSRRRTRRAEAYGDSRQSLFFFAQV